MRKTTAKTQMLNAKDRAGHSQTLKTMVPRGEPDESGIGNLPDEMLFLVLAFVGRLHFSDVSTVCKRWCAVVRSLHMKSLLKREKWHDYCHGFHKPTRYFTNETFQGNSLRLTTGDDGRLYMFDKDTVWCVEESSLTWTFESDYRNQVISLCRTFAVVGKNIYYRCSGGLRVVQDGLIYGIVHDVGQPSKIISSNKNVYVLCRKVICIVVGVKVVKTIRLPSDAWGVLMWSNMAIAGDIIYGSSLEGLMMWQDDVFTKLDAPSGSLLVHKNTLYSYNIDGMNQMYVRNPDGTVHTHKLCCNISALAINDDMVCGVNRTYLLVWEGSIAAVSVLQEPHHIPMSCAFDVYCSEKRVYVLTKVDDVLMF